MIKHLSILILSAVLLVGCQNGPNKQQVGTAAGGIIGGILGSNVGGGQGRTAAIIGGTLLGAWAGSSIGASLDQADMMYARQAQDVAYSAPLNEEIAWHNPESGHGGAFTPVREGTSSSGAYCREFQQTITIDGKTERAYGTACQMPDGTWQIRN